MKCHNLMLIALFLTILVSPVMAQPPAPPPIFGDVTDIDLCIMNCAHNGTDYLCRFGEIVKSECYAHNETGYRVPNSPFSFEVKCGTSRVLEHTELYDETAIALSEYTGEDLASELQHQSGPGGDMVHEFFVSNRYEVNRQCRAKFYVNQTNGSVVFFVEEPVFVVEESTRVTDYGSEWVGRFRLIEQARPYTCKADLFLDDKYDRPVGHYELGPDDVLQINIPTWGLILFRNYTLKAECSNQANLNIIITPSISGIEPDVEAFGSWLLAALPYFVALIALLSLLFFGAWVAWFR